MESDREVLTVLLLAAAGGAVIACCVVGAHGLVNMFQTLFFGVPVDVVSGADIPPWRRLIVPAAGALALGLAIVLLERANRLQIIDPMEANALKGGRMSASGSIILICLSILSISIGGSVGFEAAMTQLGAGLLSVCGQALKLPRRALRCLVACGAGAGITALFDAPLTGTLYAMELMIGGYALRALLPTLLASATCALVSHVLIGSSPIFRMSDPGTTQLSHYALGVGVGLGAAGIAILVMWGATSVERVQARLRVPRLLRPVMGGLVLGGLAFGHWQVLGPGHTGLHELIDTPPREVSMVGGLLVAKILASLSSVGSGFRGGLFSASLFIGGLFGAFVHLAVVEPLAGPSVHITLTILVGMTAVSAAVIGAPLTMLLLAIETTGLHEGIVVVALGVVVSSAITRRLFGYSFSTWKFHVHGQDLSGPRDVGRFRELTFARTALVEPLRLNGDERMGVAASSLPPHAAGKPETPLAVVNPAGVFLGFIARADLLEGAIRTPDLPVAMLARMPHGTKVHLDDALAGHVDVAQGAHGWFAVVDSENRLLGYAPAIEALHHYLHDLEAAYNEDSEVFGRKR